MKCLDADEAILEVGDEVNYVIGGTETTTGTIIELLPENQIKIDSDCGVLTVDAAKTTYVLNSEDYI